jgi:hypothetical protein
MRFLSTGTNANEVHKHKIKGTLCCIAQEQRQMRLLSTITSVNDVAKHNNKGKKRLKSIGTMTIEVV